MTLPQKQDAPAATGASMLNTVQDRSISNRDYTMLEAALGYAVRGWAVFPCREKPAPAGEGRSNPPKEKAPYTPNGLKDASTDRARIEAWWRKWPQAMIGVHCAQSGLFVVDLDIKHGKNGLEVFTALGLDTEGALHSQTPSGGRHLVFRGHGPSRVGRMGIDTRGEGGYFIAPPSRIQSGEFPGSYLPLDDWSRPPAELPPGLLEALFPEERKAPIHSALGAGEMGRGRLSRTTLEFMAQGAPEGHRNDRLFRAACDLAGNGFSRLEAESVLLPVAERIGTPRKEALSTLRSAYATPRSPSIPQDHPQQEDSPRASQALELFDPASLELSPYRLISGCFYAITQDREGNQVRKFLSNWHARIAQEVARDDGQEVVRKLVLEGQLASGRRLPACEVEAGAFTTMAWVLQHWGTQAIISAGMGTRDRLREAIQWASQGAESSVVYTHTGWRLLDGQRVYLSTTGALGGRGARVELNGNLKRYALPQDLEGVDPREALQASLAFLKVAPHRVTLPLWGSMFLAPLAEVTPLNFMIWVYGQTGSMKSTLSALALCHYGEFDHKTLPEGWASTDNMLEKQAFLIKDAPLVIDDFAPQASNLDVLAYERRAARLIRAIGNHSPRNRMNSDTTTRVGFMPRGLVISTGEQMPNGQSILARILPVEVLAPEIDVQALTRAQQEQAGLYRYAMAGYLKWLAGHWQEIQETYALQHAEIRNSLRGEYHLRTPEMFAHLLMGIRYALTYASEIEALAANQAELLFLLAREEMASLARLQGSHVSEELPAVRFLQAIKALLARGDYFIEGFSDLPPSDHARWLGWAAGEHYFLQSEITFNAVAEFLRREGAVLGLKQKALNAQLVEKGYIMPGDRNTYSAYHRQKGTLRTYAFYRARFDE